MSSRLKTLDDCATGRDYLEFAQANEWDVQKNGSYFEITKDGITIRFPDCARTLPKETRGMINHALLKAGLVLAALAGVVLWIL
jgi:hypothetical protein